MSYQRILVAVDGSPVSDRALEEAAELARGSGSALRIAHAVDVVNLNSDAEFGDLDQLIGSHRQVGEALLRRASEVAKAAGVEPEPALLEMDQLGRHAADAIIEEADRWDADLIVVGSHGRRGIRRWVLGSVAEQVMRLSHANVLLVRPRP